MLVLFTTQKIPSDEFIFLAYTKYCEIFNSNKKQLEIVRNGKPHFAFNNQRYPMFFSLSHSGEYIFVAISEKNVGLDIQKHDKKDIKSVAKYLFGAENMQESQCYDRFAAGEAHVKYAETELLAGLKQQTNAVNYHFLPNYSLAIESEDKSIYFMEI